MKSKFFFATLAALVAAFTLQAQTKPRIWRVNNNYVYVASNTPPQPCDHCFTNLQSAINDSDVKAGDTLHIEASPTPYGGGANQTLPITINKRLVLLGPGYFLNENQGLQHNLTPATIRGITLEPSSKGTILKGLSIGFSAGNDLRINADSVTIERCHISYITFINMTTTLSNIAIRQNFVDTHISGAAAGQDPVNNLILSNNYIGGLVSLSANFQGIATQNVFDYNSTTTGVDAYSGMKFYNNIFRRGMLLQNNSNSVGNVYNNIFNVLPTWLNVVGNTNISKDMGDVFGTGTTDGQYVPLSFCTDCIGKGMFGGPDPYRLSGVPDIPAIVILEKDANVVQGGGLPITVKTRTNN